MLIPCLMAALAIPIGLPLLMAGMLYREREGLKTHESLTRLKYDFLVKDFELEYYYFETVCRSYPPLASSLPGSLSISLSPHWPVTLVIFG